LVKQNPVFAGFFYARLDLCPKNVVNCSGKYELDKPQNK
jgi:hypothetical protein